MRWSNDTSQTILLSLIPSPTFNMKPKNDGFKEFPIPFGTIFSFQVSTLGVWGKHLQKTSCLGSNMSLTSANRGTPFSATAAKKATNGKTNSMEALHQSRTLKPRTFFKKLKRNKWSIFQMLGFVRVLVSLPTFGFTWRW